MSGWRFYRKEHDTDSSFLDEVEELLCSGELGYVFRGYECLHLVENVEVFFLENIFLLEYRLEGIDYSA